jgi:hypothetical protein
VHDSTGARASFQGLRGCGKTHLCCLRGCPPYSFQGGFRSAGSGCGRTTLSPRWGSPVSHFPTAYAVGCILAPLCGSNRRPFVRSSCRNSSSHARTGKRCASQNLGFSPASEFGPSQIRVGRFCLAVGGFPPFSWVRISLRGGGLETHISKTRDVGHRLLVGSRWSAREPSPRWRRRGASG